MQIKKYQKKVYIYNIYIVNCTFFVIFVCLSLGDPLVLYRVYPVVSTYRGLYVGFDGKFICQWIDAGGSFTITFCPRPTGSKPGFRYSICISPEVRIILLA